MNLLLVLLVKVLGQLLQSSDLGLIMISLSLEGSDGLGFKISFMYEVLVLLLEF